MNRDSAETAARESVKKYPAKKRQNRLKSEEDRLKARLNG